MTDYTLKLDGLTCGGCVKAVESALEQLQGIESFEVTQEAAKVSTNLEAETVIDAIENAGFEASLSQ